MTYTKVSRVFILVNLRQREVNKVCYLLVTELCKMSSKMFHVSIICCHLTLIYYLPSCSMKLL